MKLRYNALVGVINMDAQVTILRRTERQVVQMYLVCD